MGLPPSKWDKSKESDKADSKKGQSCPSSEIELPDKGTGCGHFIKVVMWTLLGIFGFILLIFLIFAIALDEAQEDAYGSKAKAPNKGFDRSEWATMVATFPTPIPNKE